MLTVPGMASQQSARDDGPIKIQSSEIAFIDRQPSGALYR